MSDFIKRNGCDDEFQMLINCLRQQSVKQLMEGAVNGAAMWQAEYVLYYNALLRVYKSWYGINSFDLNDIEFKNRFENLFQYMKDKTDDFCRLYESLENYRSKYTLVLMMRYWLTFHPDMSIYGKDSVFEHYFDLDIMHCDENEVFVDCGGYTGDTVIEYINQYGERYKSIYLYEMTKSSFEKAQENLEGLERIYLRNAGVSNINGETAMYNIPGDGGNNKLSPKGNEICNVVRIDDDIDEDITFIKMDIEGGELDALKGAENQIRKNKPKLAISLYHNFSDIIEIPKLVKQMVPEYKFYLQYSGHPAIPFPVDYILLAVAPEKTAD